MHVGMILEMATEGLGERVALGPREGGLTFADLGHKARRAGTLLAKAPGDNVVLVDENSPAVPLGLFGAAIAGKPFVPVSYRLADDKLRAVIERSAPALVIAGEGTADVSVGSKTWSSWSALRLPGVARRRGAAGDRRLGLRSGSGRGAPLHERYHRRTQGRGAAPPQPGRLHPRLARVRQCWRRRSRPRERPAVPHRFGLRSALQHLRRPSSCPARQLRPGSMGRSGAPRVSDPRHGCSDHAQSHPRRRGSCTAGACRPCAPSHTEVDPCPGRWSSGRSPCSTVSTW